MGWKDVARRIGEQASKQAADAARDYERKNRGNLTDAQREHLRDVENHYRDAQQTYRNNRENGNN